MPSPSPLIGRSPVSQAVAVAHPHILRLAQDMEKNHKRRDLQWQKYGAKLIEVLEPVIAATDEARQKEALREALRKGEKRSGGSHDQDWARSLVAKKKGGKVEKAKGKRAGKVSRKRGHVDVSGGYGSPLKKGYQVMVLDEDDEEELPAGFIKGESGVKAKSDDDMTMEENSDGQ